MDPISQIYELSDNFNDFTSNGTQIISILKRISGLTSKIYCKTLKNINNKSCNITSKGLVCITSTNLQNKFCNK
jgi:hypothetical protein